MLGFNGGLIGVRKTPTTTGATGLWLPNEQAMARRAEIWPISNGGMWSPADLTTELWLDFADTSTVAASGSNLLQINDKSGNGRNATGARGPTIGTVNGKACMVTTSSSYVYLASSLSTVRCFVAVIQYTNTTALQFIVGDSSSYDFHAGGGDLILDTTYSSLSVRNGSAWKNGSSVSPSSITRSSSPSCYIFNTTGNVTIRYFSEDRFYSRSTIGNTCEILALSSVLSDSDREKLEGYLAHKWGFVSSLPSTHLYLSIPP
jgi:hypothetical protein